MIEFLTVAWQLFKSTPELLGVLLELKKMWEQYLETEKRNDAMAALSSALNDARTKKDTTSLTQLVNQIISNKSVK